MMGAAERRRVVAWQPIETAPKDGTKILVFTIHGDIELSEWYGMPSIQFEEVEDGLYRKIVGEGYAGWNSNQPTHWQPLPPPPNEIEDSDHARPKRNDGDERAG